MTDFKKNDQPIYIYLFLIPCNYLLKMHCCCIPEDTNNYQNNTLDKINQTLVTSTSQHKPKFSFRSSQVSSHPPSDISKSSVIQYDHELEQLEREYQMLLEEERATEEFQRSRVSELEREVAYFEREIVQRENEIKELNTLFHIKMQERAMMAQNPVVVMKRDLHDELSNSTQPF